MGRMGRQKHSGALSTPFHDIFSPSHAYSPFFDIPLARVLSVPLGHLALEEAQWQYEWYVFIRARMQISLDL